jgi:DNA-directed RNA polymerase specialized sigma24 family protein
VSARDFAVAAVAHLGAVRAVALAITTDPRAADDIAQETFLRAWSKRSTLADPNKLRPWLCGIARNVAREHLRSNRIPEDQDAFELLTFVEELSELRRRYPDSPLLARLDDNP